MSAVPRRAALPLALLLPAGGCVSHWSGAAWGDGFTAQLAAEDQLALESGLFAATVGFAFVDHRWQRESNEHQPITGGVTSRGDGTDAALAVGAVGLGLGEWIAGDEGHAGEVLLEGFLATEGATELLKHTIDRRRPGNGTGKDSFPSGHTSFAFCMATFLQRRIADLAPDYAPYSYLLYLPAAYVGINRSEANRHWPTDVAFGAFLGVFLTNVVYDAHYGTPGHPGLFGVRGLTVEPEPEADLGIDLVFRF
ncbi:MAG: phosphatase PAP2 family protein [Planctomycetota bacterium]